MKRIGKYFGGWLDENDCDDKKDTIFIKKTETDIELTNKQKLEQLICLNIDFKYAQKVIEFLQQNEEKIKELNFGK